MKSENMLIQLYSTLHQHKNISIRRAAILKAETDNQTHLANIEHFLQLKYNNVFKMNVKILKDFQKAYLNNEILKKNLHEKLFKSKSNPIIDIESISNWLKHGNIKPQEEASLCNLQDRNMFLGVTSNVNTVKKHLRQSII